MRSRTSSAAARRKGAAPARRSIRDGIARLIRMLRRPASIRWRTTCASARAEGRLPNPLFDASAAMPSAGIQALLAGGSGSDNAQFEVPIDRIQRAAMFDETFYRERNAERLGGASPLKHFLLIGEAEGAQPYADYSPGKVRATLACTRRAGARQSVPAVRAVAARCVPRAGGAQPRARSSDLDFAGRNAVSSRTARVRCSTLVRRRRSVPLCASRSTSKSAADFVIPIVAPADALKSLSIAIEGPACRDADIARDLQKPRSNAAGRARRPRPGEIIRDPLGPRRRPARKRPALFPARQRRAADRAGDRRAGLSSGRCGPARARRCGARRDRHHRVSPGRTHRGVPRGGLPANLCGAGDGRHRG